MKGLNVRPKTIKLPEGKIGSTLLDISLHDILGEPPPWQENKSKNKINEKPKWDCIKLKKKTTKKEAQSNQHSPPLYDNDAVTMVSGKIKIWGGSEHAGIP